jgi:uncharacterized protein CbrC (UPF0167 family)
MTQVILSVEDQQALEILEDLNAPQGLGITLGFKHRLHDDQINCLKSLYQDKVQNLFLACGRKYGKTDLAGYVLWRQALMNPGSECFYITPEANHGRKIIWEGGRLQKYLGKKSGKYIQSIRNQDMTIRFKNGSYIQVVGSDNYMVANGLSPHIAVYDEFKGFNPRWHVEFAPNRTAHAAPFVFIGTKARAGNKNMEQYNEILEYAKKHPETWAVYERTTWDNPINHSPAQKKAIEEEINQLRERGEEDVVQLEYYSKVVPGGKRAVFPMFDRNTHIVSHNDIIKEVKKDAKRMQWFWVCDPGNTTVFGMLFGAFNPYTGTIYLLDEIYANSQKETSLGIIVPRGQAKAYDLYPGSSLQDDWLKISDDAAAWFMTEALSRFQLYFSPAEKWRGTKEDGLSLIKDQLLHKLVRISDRCQNLTKEMEQYAIREDGQIRKANDHLIDAYRYANMALNYDFTTITEIVRGGDPMSEGRFRRMQDDDLMNGSDDLFNESDFDLDWMW